MYTYRCLYSNVYIFIYMRIFLYLYLPVYIGPVVAMVWEGKGAVVTGRKMLGATNPADSMPGTIRGDFALETGRNICHGSDSVESAEREIALWFAEGTTTWTAHSDAWIHE
jgi:nucleoside-diphosphate kinase